MPYGCSRLFNKMYMVCVGLKVFVKFAVDAMGVGSQERVSGLYSVAIIMKTKKWIYYG